MWCSSHNSLKASEACCNLHRRAPCGLSGVVGEVGAELRDAAPRGVLPVDHQGAHAVAREHQPEHVALVEGEGVDISEERRIGIVVGEDVVATIHDYSRVACRSARASRARPASISSHSETEIAARGAGEGEEVCPLLGVEEQCPREGVEDLFGRHGSSLACSSQVYQVTPTPAELCYLFTAQPGGTPSSPDRESDLTRA